MLKPLSLIAAAAMSVLSANAATETLFSANVKDFTNEQFAEWTVEDLNGDGSTWICSSQGSSGNVYYNYNSSNAGDDWLITPAITVPEDGSYLLKFTTVGSSYGEKLEVWTGNAATSSAMTDKAAYYDLPYAETSYVEIIDLKAGNIHVGFHAVTPADAYRLYLLNVELMQSDNPVDLRVKDIVSPISGEGLAMEAVTVAIENCGGVDVTGIPVSYQLNEGQVVSETAAITLKAGETANYTFSTKGDFSQGHFRHNITAWTSHPDDINSGNDSFSTVVNHLAPANVPYATGFENTDETDGMVFLNLNQDDGRWHIAINDFWSAFSRTGDKCLAYNYNSDNNADDWAFIEPLALGEGYYAIKYWYSVLSANHPEKLRVCWGYAPTPEAMTNEILDFGKLTNEKYQQAIHIIKVDKPGSVYIGFYCYSDANENWLLIDDLSVEQIDPTKSDFSVTAISAPGQYITPAISRDVTFSIYNLGILDTDVDCVVYVDGDRLGSVGAMLRAQEEKSVTIENILSQLTPGTYELKVAVECSKDDDLSNNEMATTITIVDQPVVVYDFEDGELHEDLTYRREDTYNHNHPDAGEEFNEDGFGIFALQHKLLGSHALAVNTWYDGGGTADRWVVMPQAEITGPDAHFVFNANSFNANFKESYRVMVSTGDDRWSAYNTVLSVDDEDIYVQTRGISLAPYEGQTIYVCVHVTTYNGEALILDNLSFYGNDVKPLNLGVEGVAVDNDANAPVEYYNLQGVRVANPAKGGIYIVKQGSKASKVAF